MEPVSLIVGLALGAAVAAALLLLVRPGGDRALAEEAARVRGELSAIRSELDASRAAASASAARADASERARAVADDRASRAAGLEAQLRECSGELLASRTEAADLRAKVSALESTVASREEAHARELAQLRAWVVEVQSRMRESFAAASQEITQKGAESLLVLAQQRFATLHQQAAGELEKKEVALAGLVNPLKETLAQMQTKVGEIEAARQHAYGALGVQVQSLLRQTGSLAEALRTPKVRGAWGEMHLQRVVELAGMQEHVDFETQVHVRAEEGALRPDMVVALPGSRRIVVDAKVPLKAYLESIDAPDEATRAAKVVEHARQLRAHVEALGAKRYWAQFERSPEFVVLYVPGESYVGAALDSDHALAEDALRSGVVIASPTMLFGLLKSAAFGWRQEKLLENTRVVQDLAQELYDRAARFAEPLEKLGDRLRQSVEAYNGAVGSFEGRLLVTARRFKELGAATGKDIEPLVEVDRVARSLARPET